MDQFLNGDKPSIRDEDDILKTLEDLAAQLQYSECKSYLNCFMALCYITAVFATPALISLIAGCSIPSRPRISHVSTLALVEQPTNNDEENLEQGAISDDDNRSQL